MDYEHYKQLKDNTPMPLQHKIVDALSLLTCVRRIVSFGATAAGCNDQWSDVDLIVVCDHRDEMCWRCASVIREEFSVLFYRPFTGRAQPCGRYWFKDESPMNRLDVSFESEATYAEILSSGTKDGFEIVTRELFAATSDAAPEQDKTIASLWSPVTISQEEMDLGRHLYRALEALKFSLRGNQAFKWDRESCMRELETALQASQCQQFGGGDLRSLAETCFSINADSLQDRAQIT